MNRNDAAREVKRRYAEYLKPAKKKGTCICPLCGNGTGEDGDGMAIDPSGDGTQLKCFKCGFYGDIVDLYQQEHNCDVGRAFAEMYKFFNITIDAPESRTEPRKVTQGINVPLATENAPESRTEPKTGKPNFVSYYKKCISHITDQAARQYLTFRGISEETAARFWLGFDPAADPANAPGAAGDEYKPHPCPRLIIPFDESHYMGRSILEETPKAFRKLNNKKINDNDTVPLFNKAALYNASERPVFITEGAIDALSIIEAGGEAVATNSTGNIKKILEELKKKRTRSTLILCLDKDEGGQSATKELADGLRGLNISYILFDVCGAYKDANEHLTNNISAFVEAVAAAERAVIQPDNVLDYVRSLMGEEIESLKAQRDRKTGFCNIDAEAGSIYAGLYAVGGISSVGKTSFIYQMCDQMAAQGQHVLFFSMEQSRLELVSKSISRQTAKNNPNTAVSSIQIRTGARGENISRATAEYLQSVGNRMSIIEGNFNCTVGFISDYVKDYIRNNGGIKPVIVIDYLQVLKAEKDPETGRKPTDTKQIVDYNVTELKRMSRSLDLPIFVISSVNRSNYLAPIDFEAFKESGGIEFSCDVCWGLQLTAIHDPIFDSEIKAKIKEKREVMARAKEAIPREIELVCLKNRFGKCRYTAEFTYYPQYDYFVPKGGKRPF